MSNYNASLKYTTYGGHQLGFGLWIMEYSQSHDLAGSASQSKFFKHFYPRSYSPGPVTVTGRVSTQFRYDQLAEFIRFHQEVMVQNSGLSNAGDNQLPLLKLSIPSENFYVEGWIEAFASGAKRFNPAPEYTFDFTVVKDQHSLNVDLRPASVIRSWWNASIFNIGEIHNETDVDVIDGTAPNPYTDPKSNKTG
jgi:hypothetical protein